MRTLLEGTLAVKQLMPLTIQQFACINSCCNWRLLTGTRMQTGRCGRRASEVQVTQ
jgi:hypothetical protein